MLGAGGEGQQESKRENPGFQKKVSYLDENWQSTGARILYSSAY